jgi:hypothetical protein
VDGSSTKKTTGAEHDKLAVRCQATIHVAGINKWLTPRPGNGASSLPRVSGSARGT